MSTVAKVLVVLNVVLAAAFLGTAANYLGNQDTWKAKHADDIAAKDNKIKLHLQTIDAGQKDRNNLSDQLNIVTKERDEKLVENRRLSQENTGLKEAYTALAQNHTVLTRSADRMSNTIKANRDLITSLQDEVSRQRDAISSIQDDRDQQQQMLNSTQLSLSRAQTANKEDEKKLAGLSEQLRQAQFQLKYFNERFPGVSAMSQPAHSGRILRADGTNNVYVLSLGAEDGVKPGFQYIVSRGDKYIATIQIEDVQSKKSAGTAVSNMSQEDIQIGDTAMSGR